MELSGILEKASREHVGVVSSSFPIVTGHFEELQLTCCMSPSTPGLVGADTRWVGGWVPRPQPGHGGAEARVVHHDCVFARLMLEDVTDKVLDRGLVTHEPELSLPRLTGQVALAAIGVPLGEGR